MYIDTLFPPNYVLMPPNFSFHKVRVTLAG
jgi:hypothetical protein